MVQQQVLEKLQRQLSFHPSPLVACIDFDGTLYTAGHTMWQAPYYNHKTSRLLDRFSIPFILVTGRASWTSIAEAELQFFGMKKADVVVTGAGTMIYYRDTQGKLVADQKRLALLKKAIISWKDPKGRTHNERWDKNAILNHIFSQPFSKKLQLSYEYDSDYTIRFHVRNMPVNVLESIKSKLKNLFPEGIKILIAEKLLQKNSLSIYSGDILIVPSLAGKEAAILSLLEEYAQTALCKIKGIIFGDSSVDILMLSMPDTRNVSLFQYGVHLTPRAYRILEKDLGKNHHLTISQVDGPEVIYTVFKHLLKSDYYSPTQNSALRNVVKPFETVINRTVYPNLSANELSFKGLELVIKGIDMIYAPSATMYQKMKGLRYFMVGNSMDLFDGIRARKSIIVDSQGQLTDVFCDRIKEFYQLYKRAQQRFYHEDTKEQGYQTLLTAISCILPSLARAQAEKSGCIVKEKDTKGGSMFDRTTLLIRAFLNEVYGNSKKSFIIDRIIYDRNLATFHNRQAVIQQKKPKKLSISEQQKADTRLTLLQNLLSEEHEIIVRLLSKYPSFYKRYQKEWVPVIKPYLVKISTNQAEGNFHLDKYIKIPYM